MAAKNPRILCLDDEADNVRIRKMLLEQFGCEVVAVTNGRDCVRAATSKPFDLVLLDYHLGSSTTGEDVAKELHACQPFVPLVMLTADPDIPDSARKSVNALLIKGESNPGDLLRTIQALLPQHDLRSRHRSIVATVIPDGRPGSRGGLRAVGKLKASEGQKAPVPLVSDKRKLRRPTPN